MVSTFVYLAREYDAAIEQGKRSIDLYPASAAAYFWLAAAYEQKGLYDQAFAAYLKAKELAGTSMEELEGFRGAYQGSGIRGFR